MRKKKHETLSPLVAIKATGQILIAIGTPILLLSKLLILICVSLGNQTITQFSDLPKLVDSITPELSHLLPHFQAQQQKLVKMSKEFRTNFRTRTQIAKSLLIRPKKHARLSFSKRISPSKSPKRQFPKFHYPTFPKLATTAIAGTSLAILLFLIFYFSFFIFKDLPHPRLLAERPMALTTKIYDRNNVLLYQFYGKENRSLVKLADLPKYVPEAIIAAEDKNFYHHPGFDPAGITRAAIANYNGESAQGGSTITQQLIKFTLLSPDRTITRKIRELILSVWAEKLFTKDQILTMYLNHIGFGGPAYGIEAASEIYFGKPAKNLTLSEAALLASLPSSPTTYSPFGNHPEIAKLRQMQVLDKMAEQGYISKNEAKEAKNGQLTFVPNETEIKAPHFVMFVKDELVKRFGEKQLLEGGLQVKTSLDYELYKKATDILKAGVEKQKYLNVNNGAVLITNPKTGEILVMSGSIDFFDLTKDGNVNVTTAERSPGSSIKPLTYALALDKGIISPNTIIEDTPTQFQQVGSQPYRPQNYDNRFHGKVTIRTALGSSYNIPAVKILEKTGLINFLQFAQNAGLSTLSDPNRYGLSITLGGGEVKMVDMATAYSIFSNSGQKVDLKPILSATDSNNNEVNPASFPNPPRQLISPRTAFYINSILSDDTARAPAFGRGSALNIPNHSVAVKTGTTETKRDNWTIGYSFGNEPRLTAVWVGNNNNSPMSQMLESGNTGAAAIWNPIMKMVLGDSPNISLQIPENLIPVQVCAQTGTLPCSGCPQIVTEFYELGHEPKTACQITPTPAEVKLPAITNSPTIIPTEIENPVNQERFHRRWRRN